MQLELISVAGRSGGAARVAWRRETPEPGTAERLDADAVCLVTRISMAQLGFGRSRHQKERREKGEGKTEVRGSRGWTEEEEEAKEGGARRRTAVASGGAVVAPPCVGTERDRWGERRKPGEESGMRSGSQLYI